MCEAAKRASKKSDEKFQSKWNMVCKTEALAVIGLLQSEIDGQLFVLSKVFKRTIPFKFCKNLETFVAARIGLVMQDTLFQVLSGAKQEQEVNLRTAEN